MKGRQRKRKKKKQEQPVLRPETELHEESCETIIRENEEEAQGIKGEESKKKSAGM